MARSSVTSFIGNTLAFVLSAQAQAQQLARQEPEQATRSGPLAAEAETVTERVTVMGFPSEMRPLLECKLVGIESTQLGQLEQIEYKSLSEKNCDAALELTRTALRDALGATSPSATDRDVDFALQLFARQLDALPESGFVILEPSIMRSGASQPVPPGMWEYFVCKANENSGQVIVDGRPVAPKFKDDESCDRSRTYARREATKRLRESNPTQSAKERAALVEQYVRDIDARTSKPIAP